MVGIEIRADARIDARRSPASSLDRAALTCQPVHVRGRPTEIGDHAGEARHVVADRLDLTNDRVLAAILDDAAFVLGDRAERAAAEAAALNRHREANHLVGRDSRVAVGRMRPARVRLLVDPIHLRARQRHRRRVDPNVAFAVPLHDCPCITGIRFHVHDPRRMGIEDRIVPDLLEARQPNVGFVASRRRQAARKAHDFR